MSTTVSESSFTGTVARVVPAVVSGSRIYIDCPSWCTVDHVESPEGHLEDVWHGGDYADLKVPRMDKTPDLLAFARLGLEPMDSDPQRRKAFVAVDDGGEGFYMRPDQADEFADNLEAFAARIRAMARTARDAA
ncbi:DUF6907 domain-containing protein [Streptomyces virginiae]|uniref:DUF6907 domain-containing protein n=1 Tax=Streptomyces virginiae TaxID=1961 RepID=UPI003666B664